MVDMFWIMHDKPATFTDQGITIEVKKQKYTWEVFKNGEPDLEWRKLHTWEKFYVQYDPNDMTTVNLYAIDLAGRKRFSTVARPYWEYTVHCKIRVLRRRRRYTKLSKQVRTTALNV